MSEETLEERIQFLREWIQGSDLVERVQMIHKLLKLIVETLDGMEAEVKQKCP